MRPELFAVILAATVASFAAPSTAATWGELTGGDNGNGNGVTMPYPAGPYAATPRLGTCWGCVPAPTSGGPQGVPPAALDAPGVAQLPPGALMPAEAFLPFGREAGLPAGQTQIWTFGQVNQTTDPFNQSGLSTPFMFVPWSTPLSGWTNAQTWNWWRERSGVRPPIW